MGMFDYITFDEQDCFVCGKPIAVWQSKSGDCELQLLTPEELYKQSSDTAPYFYGYCNNDDWNNREKPHHYNQYSITPPQPMKIELAIPQEDITNERTGK